MQVPQLGVLTNAPIKQIAWMVDDVEEAVHLWAKALGAGPFWIYRSESVVRALGMWQKVEVELLRQIKEEFPVLTEMTVPGEARIAHIGWFADDVEAEAARLEAMGFTRMDFGSDENGPSYAMIDTRPLLGTMAEISRRDANRDMRRRVMQIAADEWDGTNPVRPLDQLDELVALLGAETDG